MEKYVTHNVFKKEIKGLHTKIDDRFGILDKKIDDRFGILDKKIDDRFGILDKKIDDKFGFLDQKFDGKFEGLALELVKTNERLTRVENTMATKKDLGVLQDRILGAIDYLSKKITGFDQEESVQSVHLVEVQKKVDDHEKRLSALGSPRK